MKMVGRIKRLELPLTYSFVSLVRGVSFPVGQNLSGCSSLLFPSCAVVARLPARCMFFKTMR